MILKDWLNQLFSRKQSNPGRSVPLASATPDINAVAQEEAVGLNFKAAIEAHQNWKKRLTCVVDGSSSETLQVEIVSRDDQCLLGKWIYSTGGEHFSSLEQFGRLKKNHAEFHQCAGHVLHLAQTKYKDEAMAELTEGQYAKASQEVIRDLVAVYTHVSK